MPNTRVEIEKQARAAVVQYAFFRWENATVIGGTLLLMFFLPRPLAGWPGWAWPVLGLLGVAAIVVSSLTDVKTSTKVKLELFEAQFNPREVQSTKLRAGVERALEAQRDLEAAIFGWRVAVQRPQLETIAGLTTDWLAGIYQLALCLDAYQHDADLFQERESVTKEIDVLAQREKTEENLDVKQQLADVIEGKRKQQVALFAVDERMVQVARQLEQNVEALQDASAQCVSLSLGSPAGRLERLRQDVQAQVARLDELVKQVGQIYDFDS